MSHPDAVDPVKVGMDFGTTGSAVAFTRKDFANGEFGRGTEAETPGYTKLEKANINARLGDRILLMREPEAALYYALWTNRADFRPNDMILVVDLGGGAVDMATIKIIQLGDMPQLEHICAMEGMMNGGTSVDRGLLELINSRDVPFRDLPPAVKGPGSAFHTDFEVCKWDFTGVDGPDFELQLRDQNDVPIQHVNGGIILLSRADLRGLYNPVIDRAANLINKRRDASQATKIVFVGGFAASKYVQSRLRGAFEVPGKSTVILPRKPRLAVAIGAAIYAQLGEQPRN
ncbi:hypothetical protein BJX99DRAFT_264636 [Aspergillus californicus]